MVAGIRRHMVANLERLRVSCCCQRKHDKAPNGTLLEFRLVVLSLTMHTKRHIVARRVIAMSHCRSAQIEGLAYMSNDRATSQQRAARKRAVWRASLVTRRQCDNAPFGAFR
jgi:hypothetical protein